MAAKKMMMAKGKKVPDKKEDAKGGKKAIAKMKAKKK